MGEYEFYNIIGHKIKKKVTHRFRFLNGLSLNHLHPDIKVNFIEYWETTEYVNPAEDKKGIGTKVVHFSWVTDLKITKENIVQIMRAGRSRWRIENENVKTLKEETANNLDHSYGHGKENLCTNFAYLTILSFLIDQTQEIACSLFNKALARVQWSIGIPTPWNQDFGLKALSREPLKLLRKYRSILYLSL